MYEFKDLVQRQKPLLFSIPPNPCPVFRFHAFNLKHHYYTTTIGIPYMVNSTVLSFFNRLATKAFFYSFLSFNSFVYSSEEKMGSNLISHESFLLDRLELRTYQL